MVIPHWILLLAFLHLENGFCQHIRHERTRYMSGRNQLYASGYNPNEDEANENELPIVHFWKRPLQSLENSMITPKKFISRPLFSWDLPDQTTVYSTTKESSTTSTQPFQTFSNTKAHNNDITHSPKKILVSAHGNAVKDFTAFRSSYRFLTPSSVKKKNKKSIEIKAKSKKREEQSVRSETVTKETRKKKFRRKNGRRKQGSSTFRTGSFYAQYHSTTPASSSSNSTPEKKWTTNAPTTMRTKAQSPCDLIEPKCQHLCRNVNGTAVCTCFRGFAPSGNRCVDINECEVNNGGCNGKCINTIGSRRCVCPSGYRLENVCTDINECLLRNGHGPCQDRCINTPGSYICTCEGMPGTKLSSDGHTCELSTGCDPQAHGCSHECIEFSQRTFCVCPDGFELGDDWKTCHDVDECSNPEDYNVKCQSHCVNTIGSYNCSMSTETNVDNLLK